MKKFYRTLTLLLALLLAVGTLAACGNQATKNAQKHAQDTVVATDNYSITVAMMSYLVHSTYQSWLSYYEPSGYLAYIKGEGGQALDKSVGLRDQYYSVTTDSATGETVNTTWFDYFAAIAKQDAEQILIYCEGARAADVSLDAGDLQTLDTDMQYFSNTAATDGLTTDDYIAKKFGQGVSAADVRALLELSALAAKFAARQQDILRSSISLDRAEEFYEQHWGDYNVAIDYIAYSFVAAFTPTDNAAENEAANERYEALQEVYLDRTNALQACTDAEAFTALLLGYLKEDAIAEGSTQAEAEQIAAQRLSAAIHTNYEGPRTDSDMDAWLFSAAGRKEKDTNIFQTVKQAFHENTQIYTPVKSTYTACIVTKALHRNDTKVRDVGHILFLTDTYKNLTDTSKLTGDSKLLADELLRNGVTLSAKEMSEALLRKMMQEGAMVEKTAESGTKYYEVAKEQFEKYGLRYNEDSNVFYERVTKGMMVEEFENWLFDPGRKQNEISYPAAIETTYGYHIMIYLGEGEETWLVSVKEAILEEESTNWYNAMLQQYGSPDKTGKIYRLTFENMDYITD